MGSPPLESVTALLQAWSEGDADAGRRLVPLVYGELRRRAAGYLRRERPGHTLQPTALVHEAYLKLVGHPGPWRNRSQFFGVASNLMRRILVDHARRRRAAKRDAIHVAFDEAAQPVAEHEVDLVQLDEALSALSALDARQGRVVELRYFGGLTLEEAAEVLGVSTATVKRDWTVARAWLFDRLRRN
ncbi:MAG TPA: ECF-type sigma factor [Pleomorphomonadaceae bacterium]|nr:ECF-type sigma factor [Pleomorphomonadaceae bacterium]